MRMNSQAQLRGIKSSKGEMDGRSSDSSTFHLEVDMAGSSWGESWGVVTTPFKFGDASEQQKWIKYKEILQAGKPVLCNCIFDVVAGSDNKPRLTLLAIEPAKAA